MHLYILHLALLPVIVFHFVARRVEASGTGTPRKILLGIVSLLLSVPCSVFVTTLLIIPLDYLQKSVGIETLGRELPRLWCFLVIWCLLQAGMLFAWRGVAKQSAAQIN